MKHARSIHRLITQALFTARSALVCSRRKPLAAALVLMGAALAPRVHGQFQPPVGPIATPLTLDVTSPLTHTGSAGVFTATRQTLNGGTTIKYTVDRPAGLSDVVFQRSRTLSAGFNVTAAFIGDLGLLFRVFNSDGVNVRLDVVFLDLSTPVTTERVLFSRQDFESSNPNLQFLRNAGGSCVFTRLFLTDVPSVDTFELSVFRTDTGERLGAMSARNRQSSDSFTADILDQRTPAGSDTVRIRHATTSFGNFDLFFPLPSATPEPALTARVSLRDFGAQSQGGAANAVISADGRIVAFSSDATDLVSGDVNGQRDIFVHERATGRTTRVSVRTGGTQATGGGSDDPAISADGMVVAFHSEATNLESGDTNGLSDIFVHDRSTGTTTRVSERTSGTQATGGPSSSPALSADGRFVAFHSLATNLVSGDTNAQSDVFVHDLSAGTTVRVSVNSSESQATGGVLLIPGGNTGRIGSVNPALSADGRFVAFSSPATNLVSSDSNGAQDIFVRDTLEGTTERVSVRASGTQANGASGLSPAISADGRFVAFDSVATNLLVTSDNNAASDVFVRDRNTGTTARVSVRGSSTETGGGTNATISADGRFVAFQSNAANLIPSGDTNGVSDIFLRDRTGATTTRVSVRTDGTQATGGHSVLPAISANGRFVLFVSDATNLVSGDSNSRRDAFIRDRGTL